VAQIVDAAQLSSAKYGTPEVDVTALYQPTSAYVVRSLSQETRTRPRDGKLIPTIAVLFSVPGLPGSFTIRIDNYAFDHADPLEYMQERSYLIRSLYALPARLPDYVPLGGYATGVILTLDSATATTDATGAGAVAWSGTAWGRNVDIAVRSQATAIGDFDPLLASDPMPIAASNFAVPVSGTLGPLPPDKYSVQLFAESSLGIGWSAIRAVTVP
jgi:hypothetical protein